MEHEIKMRNEWLDVELMEELLELLKRQETTDKDGPGHYMLETESYKVFYHIDKIYNIIVDDITFQ